MTMEMALRDGAAALRDRADRRERELDESPGRPQDESRDRIKAWRQSADALEAFALARELPERGLGIGV
jgi:hypothetical protein